MPRLYCLLTICALVCSARAKCGLPAIAPVSSGRIVGGVEATPHSWPWQVSLRLKDWSQQAEHYCGGSLLTDEWLATAAHCVHGAEQTYLWEIWLGAHDAISQEPGTVSQAPAKIITHEDYDPVTFSNDVALMKLPSPVALTDRVSPVCLPERTYTSGTGYVTGWGDTQEGGQQDTYPTYLQQVLAPIMDRKTCNKRVGGGVDNTMICAGFDDGEKGACSADSGGPLVMQTASGEWELAGLVSWGLYPCAQWGEPTVYADVYYFVPWIQSTIASN